MFAVSSAAAIFSIFRGSKISVSFLLLIFVSTYILYSTGRIGGVDTPFYRAVFGNSDRCSIFEYGFYQLCRLDSSTGFSVTFFFSSLMLIYTLYKKSNDHRDLSLLLLILFPTYFIIVDMGYVRQGLSASLMLIFCYNEDRRSRRLIGYVISPMFHVASVILILYFELYYRTRRGNKFLIVGAIIVSFVAIYMVQKFIDNGIIGLLKSDLNLKSIIQLVFFILLAFTASFYYRWDTLTLCYILSLTILGYFGHFYRAYLFVFPIIAFGVAGYFSTRKISSRIFCISIFLLFGVAKLSATVRDGEGLFDIPYSENSLTWFVSSAR